MVFGHPGHLGLNAAKFVVVEHRQGQGLAMGCGVMENLVQETVLKIEIVMINVAVSIISYNVLVKTNSISAVDGIWASWTSWSKCSKSCGGGTSTRTRSCNGLTCGGKPCPGSNSVNKGCNQGCCRK